VVRGEMRISEHSRIDGICRKGGLEKKPEKFLEKYETAL
jgi:hypothetical protein